MVLRKVGGIELMSQPNLKGPADAGEHQEEQLFLTGIFVTGLI